MKLKPTIDEIALFEDIKRKNNLIQDGFLMNFFKKRLKSKLDNDVELQSALKDADRELDSLRNYVKELEKQGISVPAYAKRYI
jgi:hypothetical protein